VIILGGATPAADCLGTLHVRARPPCADRDLGPAADTRPATSLGPPWATLKEHLAHLEGGDRIFRAKRWSSGATVVSKIGPCATISSGELVSRLPNRGTDRGADLWTGTQQSWAYPRAFPHRSARPVGPGPDWALATSSGESPVSPAATAVARAKFDFLGHPPKAASAASASDGSSTRRTVTHCRPPVNP